MNADVKLSQQDEDTRKQNDLTRRVGVRLTRPEQPNTSLWSSLKGVLRIR
jgi:hypothetical protein